MGDYVTSLSPAQQALLAQRLRRRAPAATITPRPAGTNPPLSHAQERLWFLEQSVPGTTACTVVQLVRLRGELDEDALRRSVAEVTARHESLRMRFSPAEDGVPAVVIDPEPRTEFRVLAAESEEHARELVDQAIARPFDLVAGPLWRVALIRLDPSDHMLALTAHHAVTDGWTGELLLNELLTLHATHHAGIESPLPQPAVQYGDYALWQRARAGTPAHERDMAFWREHLAGTPPLALPTDLPRPSDQDFAGAGQAFSIDLPLSQAIVRLGEAHGATPYMTLLAAFQALLGRWAGQSDFAVGSPVSGRGLPELDGVAGMFVNSLAMRADLEDDPTFAELLTRTAATALKAYDHQELPFDQLVNELDLERDVSRSPVFQVWFALQNYFQPGSATPNGLRVAPLGYELTASRYDLALYLFETPAGLNGAFVYATGLFLRDTIRRLGEGLVEVLRQVTADPETRVSALTLLAPDERDHVLELAAGPGVGQAERGLLHELVAAQAERTPGAAAVEHDGTRLTYRELEERSNRLGNHLRALGTRPGDRVAVCLDQSVDLAVAVLGVLKAGAAYVPLDPEHPSDRLAYVLGDAGVRMVITDAESRERLPDGLVEIAPDAGDDSGPVPAGVTPGDLAYVIYTSGTTGRPKGVMVQHREVLVYLTGMRERFEIVPGSVFALLQSLAFDFAVTVFYLSLMTGGCLHLISPRKSAAELAEYFDVNPADYLKITPSHLAALLTEGDPAGLLPRRMLILGGEASPWAWARELAARGPCAVVNHYGPTEATVGISTRTVDAAERETALTLPIGRPLPGASVYVLDENLRPVPVGVPGEIFLGGDRLARGYLGKPGLTADRFLPDPYGGPGARMYRTGDVGRWTADGSLAFMGRRDAQVKIRGYRVELGEIETVLADCPGVDQAVVELRDEHLVAYLVGEQSDVRALLRDRLPDYMIPTKYVWLDRLPLKSHGKVDRAALPPPDDVAPAEAVYVPPEGPLEEAIAAVWALVLGRERVGALDDFFELGGHSLLAIQAVARLRKQIPITLMDLFKNPTVRGLARLAEAGDDAPGGLLHLLTPPRTTTATLVCAPYGGGSAIIYKPLAEAIPDDWALYSIAVPGHELGEQARPIDEVASECAEEILNGIEGPLVLYGHCGFGVMLAVKIARLLHAAGRPIEAVYLGGVFPFTRLKGRMARIVTWIEDSASDQGWVNDLNAAGMDVAEFDPAELKLIIGNRRVGTRMAENYFGRLAEEQAEPLTCPVISVIGERDPICDFYQERYKEYHCVSTVTACVVIDEAAHYFVRYRAEELADIVTGTHQAILAGDTAPLESSTGKKTWWLQGVSRDDATPEADEPDAVRPSMRRFMGVAVGQLVSITGSALTTFAVPLWIYLTTGSLVSFALFSAVGLVPGLVAAPLAGAIVDRTDRRLVMLAGDIGSGVTQLALLILLWSGKLQVWHIYPLLVCLSVAMTFQRLAYQSAVPQLVPKRFIGHANGVVGLTNGVAQLIVPLAAAGLLAAIGLGGILVIDVVSYGVAIGTLIAIRFPDTMAWRRRETVWAEIVNGLRYSWGNTGIRSIITFFAVVNLFMSACFVMISPLVLSFATLDDVGRVSAFGGLGVFLGGLALAIWGGPRRKRLRGQLYALIAVGLFAVVIGLQENLVVIAVGVFGIFCSLTLLNGIYQTIIQVKVPQRYHGRVFALNQMVAFSTLPIGFGLLAPYVTTRLEPMLADGGPLAGTVGALIGTGTGRGIAFMYVIFGLIMAASVLVATRVNTLWNFDRLVPDSLPDDVVGLEALRAAEHAEPRLEETVA
ncbi:amino acid adenylation domain-containing protein [Streptosporangiaceae bacterium NEAU-GS5]|nr:amino acid adenylation domain-containing protein [Streptosporangiaceae bacterium NEAU-GS5]